MGKNLNEIMATKEKLHKDLVPFLSWSGAKGSKSDFQMLRHPLVYSVPYMEDLNALINMQYKQRTERTDELFKAGDYELFVFMHERPYRFQALAKATPFIKDKEYLKILSEIWVDSENIYQNLGAWKLIMKARTHLREYFMNEEELAFLETLPDKVTVYRGYQPGKNEQGLSYTLNKDKAEWFAMRFNKNGKVRERIIKKSDIFAYKSGRGEQEIIILK